ncbi:MAG: hypothetical protein ACXQS2_01685 [Methermicoccaceae archaeon]
MELTGIEKRADMFLSMQVDEIQKDDIIDLCKEYVDVVELSKNGAIPIPLVARISKKITEILKKIDEKEEECFITVGYVGIQTCKTIRDMLNKADIKNVYTKHSERGVRTIS